MQIHKKTFVVADTLIMRVFLWHRFMIISGYNIIWNKGCIFWALALWVFMLKNQTQAEKWRLFSKSLWFELCTLFSALHSFEDTEVHECGFWRKYFSVCSDWEQQTSFLTKVYHSLVKWYVNIVNIEITTCIQLWYKI